MKPFLFSLGALFFYTVFNLVFARKLATLAPLVVVPVYTLVMVSVSTAIAMTQWKSLDLPSSEQYAWLVVCGLCVLFADVCYVSALNSGGSLALVTTIICLLPVTATAFNAMLTQTVPSKTQVIAMLLAVASVVLVANDQH